MAGLEPQVVLFAPQISRKTPELGTVSPDVRQ